MSTCRIAGLRTDDALWLVLNLKEAAIAHERPGVYAYLKNELDECEQMAQALSEKIARVAGFMAVEDVTGVEYLSEWATLTLDFGEGEDTSDDDDADDDDDTSSEPWRG